MESSYYKEISQERVCAAVNDLDICAVATSGEIRTTDTLIQRYRPLVPPGAV